MMYRKEDVERFEKIYSIQRSTEEHDVSLCQYNGLSCVRCCLPHIGGDSHMEDTDEERRELCNKDYPAYRRKYENRYLGPQGLVMKFVNTHPRVPPSFEISHYEDSFDDVGKEEIEKRFARRKELFSELYNPENPKESIAKFIAQIKEEEDYTFDPKEDSAGALFSMFVGGSIGHKDGKQGELPECHLLSFIDEGLVGCLGHPLALQGYDARDHGFFSVDSCIGNSCEASKEFKFLSKSSRKVFDKFIEGMSWYEYSRHSTAVLVAYLRAYDHVIQELDKKNVLDRLSPEEIVAFTNKIFDTWPLKNMHVSEEKERRFRVPGFPVAGKTLGKENIDWLIGTEEEYEEYLASFSENLDNLGHDAVNELKKKIWIEIPYTLTTTKKGYNFELFFPDGKKIVDIKIVDGNKPFFTGSLVPELWRAGIVRTYGKECENLVVAGKRHFLDELRNCTSWNGKLEKVGNMELLSNKSIPVSERMLYHTLDSVFFKKHFKTQIKQARQHLKRSIEALIS